MKACVCHWFATLRHCSRSLSHSKQMRWANRWRFIATKVMLVKWHYTLFQMCQIMHLIFSAHRKIENDWIIVFVHTRTQSRISSVASIFIVCLISYIATRVHHRFLIDKIQIGFAFALNGHGQALHFIYSAIRHVEIDSRNSLWIFVIQFRFNLRTRFFGCFPSARFSFLTLYKSVSRASNFSPKSIQI